MPNRMACQPACMLLSHDNRNAHRHSRGSRPKASSKRMVAKGNRQISAAIISLVASSGPVTKPTSAMNRNVDQYGSGQNATS